MDRLATLHAMHGFLDINVRRKVSKTSRPYGAGRSSSAVERRGLITAPRHPIRKCSVSPSAHCKKEHLDGTDTLAMLMHLVDEETMRTRDSLHSILLPIKDPPTHHNPFLLKRVQRAAPGNYNRLPGEILVSLRYIPIENHISINLIQAKDLRADNMNSDVYIEAQLLQQCKILDKYESGTRRFAPQINFNEKFVLNISSKFHDNINLLIKVCTDTSRDPHEIGHLVLGPMGASPGVQHWNQAFDCPNMSIAAWHKLKPLIQYTRGT